MMSMNIANTKLNSNREDEFKLLIKFNVDTRTIARRGTRDHSKTNQHPFIRNRYKKETKFFSSLLLPFTFIHFSLFLNELFSFVENKKE